MIPARRDACSATVDILLRCRVASDGAASFGQRYLDFEAEQGRQRPISRVPSTYAGRFRGNALIVLELAGSLSLLGSSTFKLIGV
jgi:hypothetical protein